MSGATRRGVLLATPLVWLSASAIAAAAERIAASGASAAGVGAYPLLGMSAPASVWATREREVEAEGGEIEARRIFLSSLTASLSLVQTALSAGHFPIVSFKVNNDWRGVATGKYDAQLVGLAGRLAALNRPVAVCLHHEPDQQSTPAGVGEGGTARDFADMYRRAVPLLKAAPLVQVWPIMNGWWWTAGKARLTDAQIAVWLPTDVRRMVDGVAADDYSPAGGEPSVVKTRNRVAWMRRVGDVQAAGIGEFNGFAPSDLVDVVTYAKSEPLFRGGFLCVWNSTGGSYLPLSQTGLLDDFQRLLADWHN